MAASVTQLPLPLPPARPRRGGARPGAGRPRTRPGTWVPHRTRAWHDRQHPVHVTLRTSRRTGSLRRWRVASAIGAALRRAATSTRAADVRRRRTFRVVVFSIQPDHLHLVVEATSKTALSRGLQGLASRVARTVNRTLRRRGSLFRDRYHARALATPREVRLAVAYVLTNHRKHPEARRDAGTVPVDGIDPCSSARWFDGWRMPPDHDPRPPPVAPPRTWLLRRGWRRHRLLERDERPAALG